MSKRSLIVVVVLIVAAIAVVMMVTKSPSEAVASTKAPHPDPMVLEYSFVLEGTLMDEVNYRNYNVIISECSYGDMHGHDDFKQTMVIDGVDTHIEAKTASSSQPLNPYTVKGCSEEVARNLVKKAMHDIYRHQSPRVTSYVNRSY